MSGGERFYRRAVVSARRAETALTACSCVQCSSAVGTAIGDNLERKKQDHLGRGGALPHDPGTVALRFALFYRGGYCSGNTNVLQWPCLSLNTWGALQVWSWPYPERAALALYSGAGGVVPPAYFVVRKGKNKPQRDRSGDAGQRPATSPGEHYVKAETVRDSAGRRGAD